VVELADYRIEMSQLDQGLILVDAYLHNREGLVVSLDILKEVIIYWKDWALTNR
jgi:response regulator of citrate/malate metabolism